MQVVEARRGTPSRQEDDVVRRCEDKMKEMNNGMEGDGRSSIPA